ncbi:phosphate/phosphite/phosphonate ABC transporter substrate-binding protein [Hoeflea sp.]|uniref:phosphate/phosphite/phosphonate ABC transporter substrate-binding protein n=1 Tax=Hoeflea sp. TaxID=1940281 RepID=UPI003748817E
MPASATSKSGAWPGVAALPMYDWPEVRDATDALWSAIHAALIEEGIDAPAGLARNGDPEDLWTHPDLVLSQTCGFPYANGLSGKVALIGTPAYKLDGARPGHYFSVLVTRRSNPPESLSGLRDMRLAFNMTQSQSGFAAPVRLLADNGWVSTHEPLETGAHRASLQAVAAGQADWTAIDAVAWDLALRHEPAASNLTVFARTPETPALPLITSLRLDGQATRIANAIDGALQRLDHSIKGSLFLSGLVRSTPKDYAPLAAPLPVLKALPGFNRK